MLRLGGASAVAANQQLLASLERAEDHVAGAIDLRADGLQSLKRPHGFLQTDVEIHGLD
jgi:hypothetical protein